MRKKKHTFREWMIAVRPWSFPASAMPVVVTLGYLFASGAEMNWANGLWALVNIVVFHAAGNTWSDYFDYKRRVDAEDTYGVHTLTTGMFSPREIYRLSLILLSVALVAGVGLLLRTGWPLLLIGFGGMLCSLLYPYLKYRACGDYVIFVAYALLPTLGTAYAATHHVDWRVLLLAVPIGLITVAILHCNNTRDIQTDSRAHIRTLAMNLGGRASVWLYCFEVLFPFLWISGCALAGVLPLWTLLAWLAFVPACMNVRVVISYFRGGATAIANLDEATAKLQLLFSLVLTVAFVVAGLSAS